MLSRRGFVARIAPAALAQPRRKPNLLFLIADDHAGYVMGADGNPLAETPALDRLAGDGLRFAAHYCNSPVCTPSRQSLLTGLLPHTAGVTQLRTPLATDRQTLARQLANAGYATAVFGKMHFNRPAGPGLHGFGHMVTEGELNREWQRAVKPAPPPEGVATQKLPWQPFRTPAREWLNAARLPYPRTDEQMKSSFAARLAMNYLEENRERPFALWVSLTEPHSPFDFPIEDRQRFDPASFIAPQVAAQDAWQVPAIFRGLSEMEKRGIIASYYTSTRFLDRNMGRVLRKLRDLGLEDNTLVVYTADHGYSLGQHGRFEKHCGYDPAMRVPLLVRFPGRVRTGVVRELTEHIDVAPTILDLLGVPPFAGAHGHSLRPYCEGREHPRRRDHVFSEYLENEEVYVRTERYKLIFGSGKRERQDGYETGEPSKGREVRLFDLVADPNELHNLAVRQPQVVARLETLALERFRRTHPEAGREPARLNREEALEFYLPPRDTA